MNEELMEGHSFKEIYYVSVRTAKELPPPFPSSVIEALTWTCVPQRVRVPSLPSFQCEAMVSPWEGQDGSGSQLRSLLTQTYSRQAWPKRLGPSSLTKPQLVEQKLYPRYSKPRKLA